ncbi:hypothetical protein CBF27_01270 [Vagococcus acidifermentans]|uniref:Ig-like domain-containing protein n=1 Tax=Vagococcus acidifermentans TaxID=564710 RepID=A0A430B2U7_9ENTE|nr:hypothetical protein CBF27_01270 [Vagococcus acidifermentans]
MLNQGDNEKRQYSFGLFVRWATVGMLLCAPLSPVYANDGSQTTDIITDELTSDISSEEEQDTAPEEAENETGAEPATVASDETANEPNEKPASFESEVDSMLLEEKPSDEQVPLLGRTISSDVMLLEAHEHAERLGRLLEFMKEGTIQTAAGYGGIKALWTRNLNNCVIDPQILGNFEGDSVRFDVTFPDNIAYFEEGKSVPFTEEDTGKSTWITEGMQYALYSPEMTNDVYAVNHAGDIQVHIFASEAASYIEFVRLEDKQTGTFDTSFELRGIKSQLNVEEGSLRESSAQNAAKEHDFSGKFYTTTDMVYDFESWIKQDLTNISVQDIVIPTAAHGGSWSPEAAFIAATDSIGQQLTIDQLEITGDVDVSMPGIYPVSYQYGQTEQIAAVRVDGTWLEQLQDKVVVYRHAALDLNQALRITNSEGEEVPFDAARHVANSTLEFDEDGFIVSEPGEYEVTCRVSLPWQGSDGDRLVTVPVTVMANTLELEVPSTVDFGSYILGTPNSRLFWHSAEDISVDDTRQDSSGWQLTAKVVDSRHEDFPSVVCFNNQPLTETVVVGESRVSGKTIVSQNWGEGQGVMIDYTYAETVRTDTATIEWTLHASGEIQE